MSGKPSQPILSNAALVALFAVALSLTGCRTLLQKHAPPSIPYSTNPPAGTTVNERAKELNRKGLVAYGIGHLLEAEECFRRALEEDVGYGPAHNNLGQVYLARHQLYLAAWEFEYASSLMPELIEPIINQGLAYETGEQFDRAAEIYAEARRRAPMHPVAIASLARIRIKQDGDPYEIGVLLDEMIMHDGRQQWVEWAKELRATRYRDPCIACELALESEMNPSFDTIKNQLTPLDTQTAPEMIPSAPHQRPDHFPPDSSSIPTDPTGLAEPNPSSDAYETLEDMLLEHPPLGLFENAPQDLKAPLMSAPPWIMDGRTRSVQRLPSVLPSVPENRFVTPVSFNADAIAEQVIQLRKSN